MSLYYSPDEEDLLNIMLNVHLPGLKLNRQWDIHWYN